LTWEAGSVARNLANSAGGSRPEARSNGKLRGFEVVVVTVRLICRVSGSRSNKREERRCEEIRDDDIRIGKARDLWVMLTSGEIGI
jgi:hypothetical protein